MDDIDDIARRALGDPPEDRGARERALSMLRGRIADAATPTRDQHLGVRAAVALLLSVAIVTLLLAVMPGQTPSAAAALAALRVEAVANPTLTISPGHALESRSEMLSEERRIAVSSGATYSITVRSSVMTTTAADGSEVRTATIRSVSFPTLQDEVTWKAQGSPELPEPGDVNTEHLSGNEATWFNAGAISEDPAESLAALRGGEVAPRAPGDDQVFLLIGELLAEPSLSRDQRSALFEAAAMLDGVLALGEDEDPLGRTGESFALEQRGHRTIITFDRATGRTLAAEYVYVGAGTDDVLNWIAYGESRIIDVSGRAQAQSQQSKTRSSGRSSTWGSVGSQVCNVGHAPVQTS